RDGAGGECGGGGLAEVVGGELRRLILRVGRLSLSAAAVIDHAGGSVEVAGARILEHLGQVAALVAIGVVGVYVVEVLLLGLLAVLVVLVFELLAGCAVPCIS